MRPSTFQRVTLHNKRQVRNSETLEEQRLKKWEETACSPCCAWGGALLLGKRGNALLSLCDMIAPGDTLHHHHPSISGGSYWLDVGHWGHCKGSQEQNRALQAEGKRWPPGRPRGQPTPALPCPHRSDRGQYHAPHLQVHPRRCPTNPAQPTWSCCWSFAIPCRRDAPASCLTGCHWGGMTQQDPGPVAEPQGYHGCPWGL